MGTLARNGLRSLLTRLILKFWYRIGVYKSDN